MGLNYRQDVASAAAPRNGGGSGKQASICFADLGKALKNRHDLLKRLS